MSSAIVNLTPARRRGARGMGDGPIPDADPVVIPGQEPAPPSPPPEIVPTPPEVGPSTPPAEAPDNRPFPGDKTGRPIG